jgi:hypothetical protein
VNRPGSHDQLPITVAIVLPKGMAVDSSVVPSRPVLSDSCSRTVPPVPLYRCPTHTTFPARSVWQTVPINFFSKHGWQQGLLGEFTPA